MKKLNLRRKKILLNRNRKLIRHKRKRKDRRPHQAISSEKRSLLLQPKFKEVYAPKELTLRYENAENVLTFIKDIKRYAKRGYSIDLKLANVEKIAEGAISMLLSVLSDLDRKKVYFKGEKPINEEARDILERSGFLSYMNSSISSKNKSSKNKILTTGFTNSDQEILAPEVHKAMETVWDNEYRCPALHGGLGEMMRNSCDHAFNHKRDIVWHLGISHFENENTSKFSFVDNGIGIISTYNQKNIFRKIKNYFHDNADILYNAFLDGIKSRTNLSWRGKGLPTIFEMYEDKIITNLIVISNDVYLDFDREIKSTLKVGFSGTYYFWKINKDCIPHYFEL